jgi:hypothetical protein
MKITPDDVFILKAIGLGLLLWLLVIVVWTFVAFLRYYYRRK